MPRRIKSIFDMSRTIAERKLRAGRARFGRAKRGHEAPRDVYLKACSDIASRFAAEGFAFAKSGPRFARRCGDFVFRISFQSSHNNVAGELVAMWIHANVLSPTLRKWRGQNPSVRGDSDFVAGGQIGNLVEAHSWLEWNLANPATRDAEIRSPEQTIRRIALPYFAGFEDSNAMCRRLLREEVPSVQLADAFEFLACFDSLAAARTHAARFLAKRPHLLDEYRSQLEQFTSNGVPRHVVSAYAAVLAVLSLNFQRDLSVTSGHASHPCPKQESSRILPENAEAA